MNSDPTKPPMADGDAGPRPADAGSDGNAGTETERERWFREQLDKEHRVLLAMMRLLINGITGEGRAMRFWRWLIDDLRSERRMLAGPRPQGTDERLFIGHILALYRELRRANGSGETGSGR